ncbi:PLP-dependent aminotransferase family protein [uncultured Ellagibacter sp.]|uniref:MocR-like pyridoxine biosynthesis transcription factor PdxR n=1 Tax=uncultured Ellagibacter sp. TaxID=2137580 RepID=UPI00260167CB|nr:PLP-dependent aminotransferase family protein [uncultured Ellagibacter sp.]
MLSYDMGERGNASRYDYLYRCIRHDIAHGNILPDEKLPSKRALARNLGVSVITVEAAYAQLIAEGYVRAEERRGYFACELSPAARGGRQGGARNRGNARTGGVSGGAAGQRGFASEGATGRHAASPDSDAAQSPAASSARRLASLRFPAHTLGDSPFSESAGDSMAFVPSSGAAATALFPYQTWARVMRRTLTEESSATLAEAALAAGSPRLRQAIASYLREYRGMEVPAERIVIAAGSQTLYQLIVQLLGRERTFATECPGYPLLGRIYGAQNVHCASIPLSAGGIDIAALRESGASVAHVMPAHQFPTGIVMSAACRRDLLNWSRTDEARAFSAAGPRGRFIVEDDYDAEFRMLGRPIAPLSSVDVAGRVIYLNSFTKSLGAAFRIAYMALPEDLAAQFEFNLGFYSNTVSPLEQLALARFIEQGHYERHVNRLRTHAKQLQDELVRRVSESSLAKEVSFEGLDRGLYFSMRVRKSAQVRAVGALRAAGVQLTPLGKGPLAWSDAQTGESVFAVNCESLEIGNLVLP